MFKILFKRAEYLQPSLPTFDMSLTPDDSSLGRMSEEIRALDSDIRSSLRTSSQATGAVVVVAALATTLATDKHPRLAFVALPLLLTGAALYNFNTICEIAAMAEVRDRMSHYVNRHTALPIYLGRAIADTRRASAATLATYLLVSLTLMSVFFAGLWYAARNGAGWGLTLQIALTVFCSSSLLIAGFELPRTRVEVTAILDRSLTEIDRPFSAPKPNETGVKAFLARIFGSRK